MSYVPMYTWCTSVKWLEQNNIFTTYFVFTHIFVYTGNRNCNTTIINMACNIFQMDLLLTVTESCWAILTIKCPESKKHLNPFNLICDPNFHVKLENHSPVLKQKHPNGYFFPKFSYQWDYLQAFHFVTSWFMILRG